MSIKRCLAGLLAAAILFTQAAMAEYTLPILPRVIDELREARVADSFEALVDDTNSWTNSEGDVLYKPAIEDLQLNEDDGHYCLYYNNVLVVYMIDPPEPAYVQEMLDAVQGTLVGGWSTMEMLEIKVPSTDMDGLNALAEILMGFDDVACVDYYPYLMPASLETDGTANVLDENPWNDENLERANELLPSGSDWWAEAIGAYTAWRYADQAGPIKVGVIDSGIGDVNVDLAGKVTHLSAPVYISKLSHGTGVAGIIAAADNNSLIRGVADQAELVYCLEIDDENRYDFSGALKKMIRQGATIINMSMGLSYSSKEGYMDTLNKNYTSDWNFLKATSAVSYIWKNLTFDQQLAAYNDSIDDTAAFYQRKILFTLINQLEKGRDFLLVESAGNGYDNYGEKGYGDNQKTCFLPINERVFNAFSNGYRSKIAAMGITYQTIRERIIVVGGIEKPRNWRNYFLAYGSNYGSAVDIVAPGEEIHTLATDLDGGQQSNSGTSFAAPMVTGAAALLKSIDPDLTMPEIKQILIETGSRIKARRHSNTDDVYPLLNVGAAVESRLDHVIELSGYLSELSMAEQAAELGLDERYASNFDEPASYCTNGTVTFGSFDETDGFDGIIGEIFIDGDSDEGDPKDKEKFSLFHLTIGMGMEELDYFMERYPYKIKQYDVVDCYQFTISGIYGYDVVFQVGMLADKIAWLRYCWLDAAYVDTE